MIARTAASKASPRSSKLSNWSKLAQAGASSTTSPSSASASAAATAASSVPATTCGVVAERRGEVLRRLADQVGLGDPREERPQRLDAALLRPAAGDPADALEGERAPSRRRRRWSPCESLTMRTPRQVATSWLRCGEAGVARERRLDLPRRRARGCAPRHRRRRRSGGCARPAASPSARRSIEATCRPCAPLGEEALAGDDVPAGAGELAGDRDGDHRVAGAGLLAHGVGEEAALVLVDADDRRATARPG